MIVIGMIICLGFLAAVWGVKLQDDTELRIRATSRKLSL
jgi:hypothetical protein